MWKPSTTRVKLKRKKFSIIITPRMTQRFKNKKIDILIAWIAIVVLYP